MKKLADKDVKTAIQNKNLYDKKIEESMNIKRRENYDIRKTQTSR